MTETAIQPIGEYTAKQREILLETVAKGVRSEEFLFMLELAKKYQLDPFAKQIYCTKVGIIVSRDGYLAIAHRHPAFDGINTTFQHDDQGNIVSATTTVWRKDISHPFTETAYWSEYARDGETWKKYKHTMLQKCSERLALSRAFCITGLYADAELDVPEDELQPGEEPISQPPKYIDVTPRYVGVTPIETHEKHTEPKCPKCGGRPMEKPERDLLQATFTEQKLGELPADLCRNCTNQLYKELKGLV